MIAQETNTTNYNKMAGIMRLQA
uniref:Uncharacterized protein n=1 Tax=Rhizophora mucronata TaxID=61149 RepID=A0A2P2PS79_RHIMU